MTGKNNDRDIILLAHGDGGLLTHQLLNKFFLPHFSNHMLEVLGDAAVFGTEKGTMALSTDSFVVDPIFFPGGDIGKLAVCGTVNDLAVSGAKPLYLTASFIIEEGFPLSELEKIITSMAGASKTAGVEIIAGDTKVVGRGQADKLFINTAGIGRMLPGANLGYGRIEPGDCVLVNGPVGNHGLAIMLQRRPLGLESEIESDCAPLNLITEKLIERFKGIKFMRDLTRGGLATNAKEIAQSAGKDIWLREAAVPVDDEVRGITGLLGLDPLFLANEGKFMIIVDGDEADNLLAFLQERLDCPQASIIGEIKDGRGNIYMKTALGGTRNLNLMAGAPLPRIC